MAASLFPEPDDVDDGATQVIRKAAPPNRDAVVCGKPFDIHADCLAPKRTCVKLCQGIN